MSKSILYLLFPLSIFASPTGEKVVHGSARIERQPQLLEVKQDSARAIVEWDSFSLAGDETARFIQPGKDSAILNRVVGGNLSEIYGRMEGNGHVFLVNPNGVLIGESGRIDCGGFVAAGLDMDQQSFIENAPLQFEKGNGTVINLGQIQGGAGKVFLIGADVQNPGQASGEQGVYIQIGESSSVIVRTSVAELEQGVDNPYALAMNLDGRKEASVVRKENGRVFLDEQVSAAPAFTLVDVPGVPFADGGLYVEETLYSLQQMWSVIPERLWYQRFAILVNDAKFQSAMNTYSAHPLLMGSDPVTGLGGSSYYYLQNTVIGDPIRISDDYQQFFDSPYWKAPDQLQKLNNLQNKALK